MNEQLWSAREAGEAQASRRDVRCRSVRSIAARVAAGLLVAALNVGIASAGVPCSKQPPKSLVDTLRRQAPTLNPKVLRLALHGVGCAADQGLVKRRDLFTVIDYSMPSTEERLFVFDLSRKVLLFQELVAHGKNSGENFTQVFSNREGSLATSLGLFVTGETYIGSNGYSLRLRGLDEGFNDLASTRAIVMHGAAYVNRFTAKALGRIGRSWGCPAVRPQVARRMIDTLKGGSPIFAYYPDDNWLTRSRFLRAIDESLRPRSATRLAARRNASGGK